VYFGGFTWRFYFGGDVACEMPTGIGGLARVIAWKEFVEVAELYHRKEFSDLDAPW